MQVQERFVHLVLRVMCMCRCVCVCSNHLQQYFFLHTWRFLFRLCDLPFFEVVLPGGTTNKRKRSK